VASSASFGPDLLLLRPVTELRAISSRVNSKSMSCRTSRVGRPGRINDTLALAIVTPNPMSTYKVQKHFKTYISKPKHYYQAAE
jgi:hypothetical protein